VQEILRKCNEAKIPVTFRGAGTSLSGQAIGPGLIIDTSRHMYKYSFSAAADLVWFEPGAIAGSINARLASNHRILGPDPASVEAATMGGILANNASGMCCGIKNNSYQLIENLEFILPSGIKINTEDADSKTQFQQLCPQIFKMLSEIRLKILSSDKLYWRIKETYRIKNTIGYSLNSFIDFAHPLDIFKHLIIGSEGTLAFVSSAKMKTISKETDYLTSFVFFDSIADAIHLLEALDFEFFLAAEFFDQVSIRVLKNKLDEFELLLVASQLKDCFKQNNIKVSSEISTPIFQHSN
jgi:D-lactate dehydrogenase